MVKTIYCTETVQSIKVVGVNPRYTLDDQTYECGDINACRWSKPSDIEIPDECELSGYTGTEWTSRKGDAYVVSGKDVMQIIHHNYRPAVWLRNGAVKYLAPEEKL